MLDIEMVFFYKSENKSDLRVDNSFSLHVISFVFHSDENPGNQFQTRGFIMPSLSLTLFESKFYSRHRTEDYLEIYLHCWEICV